MNYLLSEYKIKKNVIFYLSLGTIITHELDAMTNHEWRVLPLTNWLKDEYGLLLFLFFHIPLFAILVALVASTNQTIRTRTRIGVSIFLVVHGLLHILFIGSINYEFKTVTSNFLIFGGAVLGLVYLLLEYVNKKTAST